MNDLPQIMIAFDNIDKKQSLKPQTWKMGFLARFMVIFGILSSCFDYMTFGYMLWRLPNEGYPITASDLVGQEIWNTVWFIESLFAGLIIFFVIRSSRIISRPSIIIVLMSIAVAGVACALPYIPWINNLLSFKGPSWDHWLYSIGIVIFYFFLATFIKLIFYFFENYFWSRIRCCCCRGRKDENEKKEKKDRKKNKKQQQQQLESPASIELTNASATFLDDLQLKDVVIDDIKKENIAEQDPGMPTDKIPTPQDPVDGGIAQDTTNIQI